MAEKYVFGPIELAVDPEFSRADLEFYRIDHFRPSYVAEIFFNDPEVDEASADEERSSYAGRFAIFGHERCLGDEGHCDPHQGVRRFDDRPSNPLTPAFKRVVVTEAVRRLAGADKLTVTVIATAAPDAEGDYEGSLLSFEGLQLTTFR
jgi:hypothetical protein